MRRGGHANPRAAFGYQHATEDRDRAIADALAGLALSQATRVPVKGGVDHEAQGSDDHKRLSSRSSGLVGRNQRTASTRRAAI